MFSSGGRIVLTIIPGARAGGTGDHNLYCAPVPPGLEVLQSPCTACPGDVKSALVSGPDRIAPVSLIHPPL